MCFGMPSHMGGVLVGLFIIILGAALLYQNFARINLEIFWPLLLVFVGIAVLVGGAYRYSRR